MKRFGAVCMTAALVALGIGGFATVAAADDGMPEEVVVVETPITEPEVVVEETPIVEDVSSARVQSTETETEKLAICHSGSGSHWSFIGPDASGYNGHQNHDSDIYGLTEVECLAKNVVVEETDVDYVTVAWLAGDAPPNHFDVPQHYLFSEETDEPSLATLDDEIEEYLAGLKCGEDADIQVDVYYDNSTTDSLIAGEVLYGPSNPDEDLIPGGAGTAWKFVHLEADDCEVVTNVVCETNADGGTATNLNANGWLDFDTRSAGHAEYVEGGLHIYTDTDASGSPDPRKVSWAHGLNIPLSQVGQFAIDYTNTGSFPYGPGINIFVNFGADGNGTLVYEDVYGQDLWLTNGSSATVKANAPVNGGGNGSQWHGTIDQWLSVYPDAQITGFAFALGSGVNAEGVLHSLTVGCTTYSFDYETFEVPVPSLFSAEPTPPTCEVNGSFDFSGEFQNVTVVVTPEPATPVEPGVYTIVADTVGDAVFPDGTTHKEIEITVLGQIATQSENSEAPCYQAPPEEPEEPITPVTPQGLALTGGTMGMLPLGAALLILAGLLAVLIPVSIRRGWVS